MTHMAKKSSPSTRGTTAATPPAPSARRPPASSGGPGASTQAQPLQQAPRDAVDARTRAESMGSEPSEEDIRLRAYQKYLGRGCGHGLDCDDWLQAERELRRKE